MTRLTQRLHTLAIVATVLLAALGLGPRSAVIDCGFNWSFSVVIGTWQL